MAALKMEELAKGMSPELSLSDMERLAARMGDDAVAYSPAEIESVGFRERMLDIDDFEGGRLDDPAVLEAMVFGAVLGLPKLLEQLFNLSNAQKMSFAERLYWIASAAEYSLEEDREMEQLKRAQANQSQVVNWWDKNPESATLRKADSDLNWGIYRMWTTVKARKIQALLSSPGIVEPKLAAFAGSCPEEIIELIDAGESKIDRRLRAQDEQEGTR